MASPADESSVFREIRNELSSARHEAPSPYKYKDLERAIGRASGLLIDQVYATHVSKAGNASVRMIQSARAQSADLVVGVISRPEQVERTIAAVRRVAPRATTNPYFVLVGKVDPYNLEEVNDWNFIWGAEPYSQAQARHPDYTPLILLAEETNNFPIQTYQPSEELETPEPERPQAIAPTGPGPINIPLDMDDRVLRMVRTAIMSNRAVMLVGPPGTGKSTLVRKIADDIAENPQAYNLEAPHDLFTVTADESWTTRELVGGDSIDRNNELKFAPGHVLQAIMQDKWLFLEEANRADLDRIFGGLLSWLSGQRNVVVGRLNPTGNTEIVLDWSGKPESVAPEDWDPDSYDGEDQITFAAGDDWRLIGTYNSLDAHRVFKLGLALGRRFAQVPIPAPTVDRFSSLVEKVLSDPEWSDADRASLGKALVGIYQAHMSSSAAVLGPALFLELAKYVKIALSVNPLANRTELLAEGYLATFGTWLSRMDVDDRTFIGQELTDEALLGGQWEWVDRQVSNFG
ncbi:AAA family ATPase [Actinomycetospora callitridis]|uniref:AAA family ATPase n=1 Tax=Actinomycetospora callitridis TaxID=913944 RepID=UPI002365C04A|nr:AAA family ATPase [Actinomycetospora callitridis]MDD7919684.1 AAA family ATPase [Actinomycetospora callitridis]